MNTNMTGFGWFSKIFASLYESSPSIGRVKSRVQHYTITPGPAGGQLTTGPIARGYRKLVGAIMIYFYVVLLAKKETF